MPPRQRRPRVPSLEERTEYAIALGLIAPGESLSPTLQTKTAQLIALAEQIEDEEDRAAAADPVPEITDTYARLIEAGLPDFAAASIVAALAPGIAGRANQGAAHAPQD